MDHFPPVSSSTHTFCHCWWHEQQDPSQLGPGTTVGWFNQAKPDAHNITEWISCWSPSLTGLFFSHLTARRPWKGLVVGSFYRIVVSQDSSNPVFPAQLSPQECCRASCSSQAAPACPLCCRQVAEDAEGFGHQLYLDIHINNVDRASLHF